MDFKYIGYPVSAGLESALCAIYKGFFRCVRDFGDVWNPSRR